MFRMLIEDEGIEKEKVEQLEKDIDTMFKDFMHALYPSILHNAEEELGDLKDYKNRLFLSSGIDIMIDANLKPWVIEINWDSGLSIIVDPNETFEEFEQPFTDVTYQVLKDVVAIASIYRHNCKSLETLETYNKTYKLSTDSIKEIDSKYDVMYSVKSLFNVFAINSKINLDSFLNISSYRPNPPEALTLSVLTQIFTDFASPAITFESFKYALLKISDLCSVSMSSFPSFLRQILIQT